jgi:hypothetical protein
MRGTKEYTLGAQEGTQEGHKRVYEEHTRVLARSTEGYI